MQDGAQQPEETLQALSHIDVDMPLDEVEKTTILRTLDAVAGNKSEAARRLGITRKTLHKKLKQYGVMKSIT